MKNFLNWKTILSTIILSLIASALWENLFRDVFSFLSKIILTIATLGIETYRDNMYVSIAQGFYEQVGIETFKMIMGVFLGIVVGSIIVLLKREENLLKIKSSKIKEYFNSRKSFYRIVILAYIFFVIGITILSLSKIIYINKSISYYKQLETIASPYITEAQEKNFNSKFAQIKTKYDYLLITDSLVKIIKENNQILPKAPSFVF